jgi:hypothetical protein
MIAAPQRIDLTTLTYQPSACGGLPCQLVFLFLQVPCSAFANALRWQAKRRWRAPSWTWSGMVRDMLNYAREIEHVPG